MSILKEPRIVRVRVEYDDGTGSELTGEDAARWHTMLAQMGDARPDIRGKMGALSWVKSYRKCEVNERDNPYSRGACERGTVGCYLDHSFEKPSPVIDYEWFTDDDPRRCLAETSGMRCSRPIHPEMFQHMAKDKDGTIRYWRILPAPLP